MNISEIGIVVALCLSAAGSALGTSVAAQVAIGGYKKCYREGKPAPFIMIAFVGAPLTQIIYGFLLTNFIKTGIQSGTSEIMAFLIGALGGLVIGMSGFFQGKAGACACDSLAETGKGTANYFIVVGIIETVALFTLVFSMLLMGK